MGANEIDEGLSTSQNPPCPYRRTVRRAGGAPSAGSIPTIARSFKSSTTRRYRQIVNEPDARLWQRNYYEHILRNEAELARIREYILDNPRR